jgi:hypothetical protein
MKLGMPPLALMCLLALGSANAWLLNVILSELEPIAQPVLASGERTGAIGVPITVSLRQSPLSAYGQALAHPLFFKTRSPYVPPPTALSKPNPPPAVAVPDPILSVAGIIIDDKLKKAYLIKQNEPQGAWVTEGEVVQGWTVQTITPSGIAVKQNQRTIEFALYPPR